MNNKESDQKLKDKIIVPDMNEASQFLSFLEPDSDLENEKFVFQIIPEGNKNFGNKSNQRMNAKIYTGTFEGCKDLLKKKNLEGYGVFVTVNLTDGTGRKTENVTGVRALFVDLDGSPLEPILRGSLMPHMIVESSPGRFHAYWKVKGVKCDEFKEVQQNLIGTFDSDPSVCDLPRVMRIPGFLHLKGTPFQSKVLHFEKKQPYEKQEFFKTFGIFLKSKEAKQSSESVMSNDPIVSELDRHGLLIKKDKQFEGKWIIKCPWSHLHSKQDHGTAYFEQNQCEYPLGGFNCFHNHCSSRSLNHLLDYLGISSRNHVDPMPLFRRLGPPQSYPIDALGSVMGSAVEAMNRIIQAPDAICAQSVLGAAALACQPFVNIKIDGREIPISEFFLTGGVSGDRKSAADDVSLKPIRKHQKEIVEKYKLKKKQLKSQIEQMSSGLEEKRLALEETLEPLILVEEPTFEGIVKYLAVGQPSIGLFSDEGARFIGGYSMTREKRAATIAGLSSLWDGKEITRLRGGDGYSILYGRRVSLHLMMQENILQEFMSDKMVEQQGFLARCLISYPNTMVGKRKYLERDILNEPSVVRYHQQLESLLKKSHPIDDSSILHNELKPAHLQLSRDAKNEWVKYHNSIENELSEGGRLEQIRRFGSKAAEHVLRLAGILSIFESIEPCEIQICAIQQAIILVEYYLNEALRIKGCISVDPKIMSAQNLLNWCASRNISEISLQDIYQEGPYDIRVAEKARTIISLLEEHGCARPISKSLRIGKNNMWKIIQPE